LHTHRVKINEITNALSYPKSVHMHLLIVHDGQAHRDQNGLNKNTRLKDQWPISEPTQYNEGGPNNLPLCVKFRSLE